MIMSQARELTVLRSVSSVGLFWSYLVVVVDLHYVPLAVADSPEDVR